MGKIFSSIGKLTSSLLGGDSQIAQQKKAALISQMQADRTYRLQQEAMNKENARTPDVDTIKSDNKTYSPTMLTGESGVDLEENKKKRRTLLGE